MSTEVKVPPLPESVSDATVAVWYKNIGDPIHKDEPLVGLETDKVVFDVPSPVSGILRSINKEQKAIVKAEDILGHIEDSTEKINDMKKSSTTSGGIQEESSKAHKSNPPLDSGGPAARRRRAQAHSIPGKKSEQEAVKPSEIPNTSPPKEETTVFSKEPKNSDMHWARSEERVPMSRLRARIAERLLEAQQNTASLTTFNEIDLQKVIEYRTLYKDSFKHKYDVKLGFMSFFIKAVIEALKEYPTVNASIEGNEIVYHHYVDMGIAVSTDRGLVVPVLRDAQNLSFSDIEKAIECYGRKAKENQITLEDLTGGTFTITNGGVFGSLLSTPIINPPQSAILGMHKIEERPKVEKGSVVVRPMMYVALTYDHRLIDGKDSVGFLKKVKESLEDPVRLLIHL